MQIIRELFYGPLMRAVAVLFAAAVLLSVAVYPEVFLTFRTSFILWSDYNLERSLSFILTNFLYQGGLQLWDYYGQMPMTFVYATYGIFKFQNVVATLLYATLSPFSSDSAQIFHQTFVWGNLFSGLFLRLAGIVLLLSLVTKNRWIILPSAAVGAVFFNQPAFLWGTFCFNLLPLGMYLAVRFFQEFRLRYLAALYLFFIVSIGNGLIHTAGCLYFQLHFLVLACIIWSCIHNRRGWRSLIGQVKGTKPFFLGRSIFLMVLAFIFIVGPYLYILKFGMNDVVYNAKESRVGSMFDPQYYFKKMEISLANPRHFFADTLNFERLTNPTVFSGLMIMFLAITGLVVSRNTVKWLFGLAVLLIWLINHPRDTVNIGLVMHWVNVLTNPLKTILRSYLVGSYVLLSFLLLPLAALGIEEIVRLCSGKPFVRARWNAAGAVLAILAVTSVPVLPPVCGYYVIALTALIILAIAWMNLKDQRLPRIFFAVIVAVFTVLDIGIAVATAKDLLADYVRTPTVFESAPQSGKVGYEVANPKIFPFRQFYTTDFSFNDEVALWFPRGISADFRHMTNQTVNFLFINGHCPRHKTFESWVGDPLMPHYVGQNKRTMFVAAEAVEASPDMFNRIIRSGLARDVVAVDDPDGQLNLPVTWSESIQPSAKDKIDYKQLRSTLAQVKKLREQGDMVIFSMALPADFPAHLSSTFFADDQRYLQFLVQRDGNNWIAASHAQGELVRPYTFDVQNIKEGTLTAAVPKADFVPGRQFAFFYPSDQNTGVLKLWKSQYDNMGMDYRAKRSGWAVLHYPYDKKWKITVDGKETRYYPVNKSFIGFPITQGDHKILVQYWPHTSLRWWLLISMVLTTIGLPVLLWWALKRAEEHLKTESSL